MIAATPGALQLRLYQTLVEVSGEARSTIVFPVPIDLTGMGVSASGGNSPPPLQAMMQSAVALAATEGQKRLTEGATARTLEDGHLRARTNVREEPAQKD